MSLPWNWSKEQIICGISTFNKSDQTVDEKNRPEIKLVIDRVAKVMKPGPMSSLKFIIKTFLSMIQIRVRRTQVFQVRPT